MKYFVVGDLGTSGIKVGLVSEEREVQESLYLPTRYSARGPGRMIQGCDDFVAEFLKGVRFLLGKSTVSPGDVVALSLSGQMGGIIGVDGDFRSLTGLDMGLDLQSERYNRLFQEQYAAFVNLTSCGSPRNFPKILWWKKERPEIYKKVAKFVTLNGYVAGRLANLSGEEAFVDYTLLSFFGNEEMETMQWSEDLSRDLGVALDKFPRIVTPWDVVGKLSPWAASRCGLCAGTPIVAGLGDQPAGFLGGGFCVPGVLVDVAGSSTILSLFVDKPVRKREAPEVMYMISATASGYHAFTYINGGGTTIRWFVDEFVGKQNDTQEGWYEWITEKSASLPPGSGGLLFLPYFGGRQCPYDASVRGGFVGLSWWHKKEHLFRAILESLAYDYALGLRALREAFPCYQWAKVFATGSGARNRLWNAIKASVLGLPYFPVDDYKFPLLGCAVVAGYG
ncbi:MAG: FGGY-family carbohydrate kinase, partial [Candidatus Caldatribacteriaceae bacterium]